MERFSVVTETFYFIPAINLWWSLAPLSIYLSIYLSTYLPTYLSAYYLFFHPVLNTYKTSTVRLLQDGRVEGHALTPSCENTGITTNCWTIIDRKTLELTKKGTPHPRKKEKPQWDGRRGATTIKSNPINAGWVTHKLENNYTTAVHPLEWRFWAPRQASQPGGLATGGGIPRESDFEG